MGNGALVKKWQRGRVWPTTMENWANKFLGKMIVGPESVDQESLSFSYHTAAPTHFGQSLDLKSGPWLSVKRPKPFHPNALG